MVCRKDWMQEGVEGPAHEEVARWAEWNELLNWCTKAGLWKSEQKTKMTPDCIAAIATLLCMVNVHIIIALPLVLVHCSALRKTHYGSVWKNLKFLKNK